MTSLKAGHIYEKLEMRMTQSPISNLSSPEQAE